MNIDAVWAVISPFVNTLLGAVGIGLAGWIAIKFNTMQKKAALAASVKEQEDADAAALAKAQSHFSTMQKIGIVASGYAEQVLPKDTPNSVREKFAQDYIQSTLLPQAGETATPEETLPHVLAGVAALPPTNPVTVDLGTLQEVPHENS